jgi:hypothetical protein
MITFQIAVATLAVAAFYVAMWTPDTPTVMDTTTAAPKPSSARLAGPRQHQGGRWEQCCRLRSTCRFPGGPEPHDRRCTAHRRTGGRERRVRRRAAPLHHSHLHRWPHRRTDRAPREKTTRPKAGPPASWAISRLQSRAEVTCRRDAEGAVSLRLWCWRRGDNTGCKQSSAHLLRPACEAGQRSYHLSTRRRVQGISLRETVGPDS